MITFVTSNRHKFREVEIIFNRHSRQLQWKEMKYEEIQADTTEEVSLNSCEKLRGRIEGDFFIEDTGLFIDHLNGFPGVYSSYVEKTIGNEGILKLLAESPREGNFKTVITASLGGEIMQFKGILRGSISLEPRGKEGFGYDPIFVPEGEKETLSEMSSEMKSTLSHRYKAVAGLLDYLSGSSRFP